MTKEKGLNIIKKYFYVRDLSSAGRASALQAEGHRFEPYRSHFYAVQLIIWRSSSAGESTRFIPAVSAVQIRPSLLILEDVFHTHLFLYTNINKLLAETL